MDLGRYLYELLQTHDCVILPQLGGFITRKEGANIHSVQNLFTPPTRTVLFNEQLVRNDGLLANFIASKEGIEYHVALKNLMFQINEILFSLYKGETVEFTQIGSLSIKNEKIHFEPHTSLYIQEESYGLNSFIMPMIQRERNYPQKQISPLLVDNVKTNHHIGRYVSIAATVVILLGCFAYLSLFQNPTYFSLGDLCPTFKSLFIKTETSKTVEPTIQQTPPAPFEKPAIFKDIVLNHTETINEHPTNSVDIEQPPSNIETKSIETEPIIETPTQPATSKTYYIIGASYERRVNAENKCEEIKALGYDATVLEAPNIGRFRVSYGVFNDKEQADILLKEVRENHRSDAWLLIYK